MYARGNPLTYSDPSGHVAVCFRGSPNSSKNGEDAVGVHELCNQALDEAGYDQKVHGAIHYFDYNGSGRIQDAINAILSRAEGEPAILIGHSWGGAGALTVAAELEAFQGHLSNAPLANMELAARANIDLLITIDPVLTFRDAPDEVPSNVDKAMNIAAKDGWPGLFGNDDHNVQNGVNEIDGALNIDLENVPSAAHGTVRMDHHNITNLAASNDERKGHMETNPVARYYMKRAILATIR